MIKRAASGAPKKAGSSSATAPAKKVERIAKPGMENENKEIRGAINKALLVPPYLMKNDEDEDAFAFSVAYVWHDLQDKVVVGLHCNEDFEPGDAATRKLADQLLEKVQKAKPQLLPKGYELELLKV